jgi:C4-dicarboxylate transporter
MNRALRPSFGGVLYSAVVVTTVVGLLLVALGAWRTGVGVCGGGLVAAGVGRAVIPERTSGLLRVRRRGTDVVIMLTLGIALVVLATIVPDQP